MSQPPPSSQPPGSERALVYLGWVLGAGVAALCVVRELQMVRIGDVLAGVSILTGFLFGTLAFVFQLRLRITDDPNVPSFGRLRRLIDLAFQHLTAATGTALATTVIAVLADVTAPNDPALDPAINTAWTATVALLGVRLLTLLPLVVWDLKKAYREIPG